MLHRNFIITLNYCYFNCTNRIINVKKIYQSINFFNMSTNDLNICTIMLSFINDFHYCNFEKIFFIYLCINAFIYAFIYFIYFIYFNVIYLDI